MTMDNKGGSPQRNQNSCMSFLKSKNDKQQISVWSFWCSVPSPLIPPMLVRSAACKHPRAKLKHPVFSDTSFAIKTINTSHKPAQIPSNVSQGIKEIHTLPPCARIHQTSVAAVRKARTVTVMQATRIKGFRPKSAQRPATTWDLLETLEISTWKNKVASYLLWS